MTRLLGGALLISISALVLALTLGVPSVGLAESLSSHMTECDQELRRASLPSDLTINPIQRVYWEWLAQGKHLIPQDDPALMTRPLLRSDSETSQICGSMCALHMVRMVRALDGIADPFSSEEQELENMARIMWMKRIRIKEGLLPSELAEVIKTMLNEGSIRDYADPKVIDILMGDGVVKATDVVPPGEAVATFIRVGATDPETGQALGSHVMFEVGASPRSQEIVLLDPMDPDHPIRAKLIDRGGSNGVEVSFSRTPRFSSGKTYIRGVTTLQLPLPAGRHP